jgi:hypothetical protein
MIADNSLMPDSNAEPANRRAGKRTSRNRPTEKIGARVATGLFEDAGMIVQQVDQANDIGKDLFVDLADDGVFTGDLIAVQVKSGPSYRRGSSSRMKLNGRSFALTRRRAFGAAGPPTRPYQASRRAASAWAWAINAAISPPANRPAHA